MTDFIPNNSTAASCASSYKNATGPIGYGMTNDYMFRTVLQKNHYVLKGLVCSLLHLEFDEVSSIEITNPISLSDSVDDKEFILDINVLLNSNTLINLEMQMAYQYDWNDRSLIYLCRSFDQLFHGASYSDTKKAIHIGFLNFTPRELTPEFYACNKLMNEKTHEVYNDKFALRVVNLRHIDLATEEDRAYKIDYWARLFISTTWEEIKMFADEPLLDSALQSIYEANADEITRQKCQAREEYNRREKLFAEQDEMMKVLTKQLSEKDSEILALRKLLKQNGISTDSLSLPEEK